MYCLFVRSPFNAHYSMAYDYVRYLEGLFLALVPLLMVGVVSRLLAGLLEAK